MPDTVISELEYSRDRDVVELQTHDLFLRGECVTLRPMTECDWGLLLAWNNDPEVMEHVESDGFTPRSLSEIQSIYRWISTHAYCFIIEVQGQGIGECWLQRMNLRRIVGRHPGENLWRIDLMIGVKELWGRGYGREAIGTLVEFGFDRVGADAFYGLVAKGNTRSTRAFQKCGFTSLDKAHEAGDAVGYDMVITSAVVMTS
ncbi:MAG: GNAT family N-acetyltransferase [Chloroflexi bacterium]|nr:GNAT family N-acetyltransferase [Chloroflexota bacterium]